MKSIKIGKKTFGICKLSKYSMKMIKSYGGQYPVLPSIGNLRVANYLFWIMR